MNKKRVLIISTVGLIYDGITSIIVAYLEALKTDILDIRIVATIKSEKTIQSKIEDLGYKIVVLPDRKNNTLRYFLNLIKYIRDENIEIVHAHGNSGTMAIEMIAGFLGGAKKRLAHSHNTKCDQVAADKLLRPVFNMFYTDALACGREAGKWLFGDKPFIILPNGRNVEKYKYNVAVRYRMREKYDLDDCVVIGNVGGFVEQKNHRFIVEVFREVLLTLPSAKLCLIGDGILRDEIENRVEDIKKSVMFIGNTDHVEDYLQMMDIMILPSLFEGLPLVLIEWQINGLPCLVSDVVTSESKLLDTTVFISKNSNPSEWASKMVELIEVYDRSKNSIEGQKRAKEQGFDIIENGKILIDIYLH